LGGVWRINSWRVAMGRWTALILCLGGTTTWEDAVQAVKDANPK
jgi:hypothetical protein